MTGGGDINTLPTRWHGRHARKILSDSAFYSRENLGEAIFGQEYARRCKNMRKGSRDLLAAIERDHLVGRPR